MNSIKEKRIRKRTRKKKVIWFLFIVFLLSGSACAGYVVFRMQQHVISPLALPFTGKVTQAFSKTSVGNKELEEVLKKNDIPFENISRNDERSYLVKLTNEEEVIISSEKAYDTQVSSLQLLLSRLTIEGKRIARIDLRYENPVVVFQ